MVLAKLVIIFLLITSFVMNLCWWGEPKDENWGGVLFLISLLISLVLYGFAGIFEPITRLFQ